MAYYDMWQVEVRHKELNKFRLVRGRDKYVVEQTAAALKASWDEIWRRRQEKEDKKQVAIDRTIEAQDTIEGIKNTLQHTLSINDTIDWDSLLDRSKYPKAMPQNPKLVTVPIEPQEGGFIPSINFFINMFPSLRARKITEAKHFFEQAHSYWEKKKVVIENNNKKAQEEYNKELLRWKEEEKEYVLRREEKNRRILEKKEKYFKKEPSMIAEYCEMVLAKSQYPDDFPQEFDVEFISSTGVLLIDYFLPSIENISTLKEVRYITSNDQIKEIYISETELNKLYDSLLYQITLRTIHELYEADAIDVIVSIIFNGYVKFIDKGTGKQASACILSIQVSKKEFLNINLESVDPKVCFKNLKGIGSSKLHGLAPIAPIMKLNKEDKRFVMPYEMVNQIDETTNIAAMDWQDFENLIRELFEKEFAPEGGEVKITRASRDEGVDAVIFDPDPLRGGKIVIQAKRYTNTVGLSAVRDLYGTVMNEGAMKGILVTTTDYGPDAYKFAQDKPLTLLNGSNLLHLLEKHGHKARIDIKEAKLELGEKIKE